MKDRCPRKLLLPHTESVVVQCVRDEDHSTGDKEWHAAYTISDLGVRVVVQWKDQPCQQCG